MKCIPLPDIDDGLEELQKTEGTVQKPMRAMCTQPNMTTVILYLSYLLCVVSSATSTRLLLNLLTILFLFIKNSLRPMWNALSLSFVGEAVISYLSSTRLISVGEST